MKMTFPGNSNLRKLVRGLETRIPKDIRVFEAFKKYGEFTDEQARSALKWGNPPGIELGTLDGRTWGKTEPGATFFTLNKHLIKQFEFLCWAARHSSDPYESSWAVRDQRRDWDRLLKRAHLLIEALVLHECVHWGDGQVYEGSHPDKYRRETRAAQQAGFLDRGHQFEWAAYGRRLPRSKGWNGLWSIGRQIDGWMGTVRLMDKSYRYFDPLASHRQAPLRPPRSRP